MLPIFSLTLGLSFLCGINLYLATFLTSLAVREGWVDAALHPALSGLGHPAVMIVALVLFLTEFIFDKIPWVDSLWDAVHTLIRPVGAVILSYVALDGAHLTGSGTTAVLAVLGGLIALGTHFTKSGVRLLINASPEPFTNILASLAEDIAVVLLLLLLIHAPVSGFAVCLGLLAGTWIVLPRLFRLVKASVFLVWKRCTGSHAGIHHGALPASLTLTQENLLSRTFGDDYTVPAWSTACVTGKIRGEDGLRGNLFGTLLSPAAHPGTLVFLTKGWFRRRAVRLSLAGCQVRAESSRLSADLVVFRPEDGRQLVFRFTRAEAPVVARLSQDLNARLGLAGPARAPTGQLPPAEAATEVWTIPGSLRN